MHPPHHHLYHIQSILFLAFIRPASNIRLTRTCNGQIRRRNILRNGRAGTYIGTISHLHRSNKIRIAANERIIAHLCAELRLAIIIDGNRTTAHIDARAHIAVPDIGQMRQLRAFTDIGVFDLDEIADLDLMCQLRIRTKMDIWSKNDLISNLAFMPIGEMSRDMIADLRIRETRIRTDHKLHRPWLYLRAR